MRQVCATAPSIRSTRSPSRTVVAHPREIGPRARTRLRTVGAQHTFPLMPHGGNRKNITAHIVFTLLPGRVHLSIHLPPKPLLKAYPRRLTRRHARNTRYSQSRYPEKRENPAQNTLSRPRVTTGPDQAASRRAPDSHDQKLASMSPVSYRNKGPGGELTVSGIAVRIFLTLSSDMLPVPPWGGGNLIFGGYPNANVPGRFLSARRAREVGKDPNTCSRSARRSRSVSVK